MKILFFGDVVGKPGRQALKKFLPSLREKYQPDAVLINGENLTHGTGITLTTWEEMLQLGVDLITSGNHVWKYSEVEKIFAKKNCRLIRPANYPDGVAGQGEYILEIGTKKLLVLNLLGRVFMKEGYDCPFRKADEILKKYSREKFAGIIVDFHAEATSEKRALGWYLDGRVSAVLGTHTHIATADAEILSQGTAYISDVGMVGANDSVIGVDKNQIIKRFLLQTMNQFEVPEKAETAVINGVFVKIDDKTSQALKIELINDKVSLK